MPRGLIQTPLQKTTFPVEFPDKIAPLIRVRQTMIICEKKMKKSVPFQNGGHFTDCAIPRKLKKKTFPEGEFQRNLAQISRSLIKTHN